jgi:hypothetical protein
VSASVPHHVGFADASSRYEVNAYLAYADAGRMLPVTRTPFLPMIREKPAYETVRAVLLRNLTEEKLRKSEAAPRQHIEEPEEAQDSDTTLGAV